MQPSLPLFSSEPVKKKRKKAAAGSQPMDRDGKAEKVDGLGGFLVGDVVRVDGLRGRFRCRAFFIDGDTPSAEVFGPLLDGRAAARVPAVRTFPLERLRRPARKR